MNYKKINSFTWFYNKRFSKIKLKKKKYCDIKNIEKYNKIII